MKYIKLFELKKRYGHGAYPWYSQEKEILTHLGFEGYNNEYTTYSYIPEYDEKIESIFISKLNEPDKINYFYCVNVASINKKTTQTDFEIFSTMIEFVKKYVSDFNLDIKKYNI